MPHRLGEIAGRRTERAKHYLLEDGSCEMVCMGRPMHWRDSSGNWQDIDCTLVPDSGQPGYDHACTRVPFDWRLAQHAKEPMRFQAAGASLVLRAQGGNPARAVIVGNQATYANAWTDTDLILEVMPTGVKETIVLKTANAPTQFRWRLEARDCLLVQRGTQVVAERDGQPLFALRRPTAQDAQGRDCPAAQTWSGTDLTLTVTVPMGVTYPIRVDPTVQLWGHAEDGLVARRSGGGWGTCVDAWNAYGQSPGWIVEAAWPSFSAMRLTEQDGITLDWQIDNRRAYPSFDTAPLPDGAIISEVSLNLFVSSVSGTFNLEVFLGTWTPPLTGGLAHWDAFTTLLWTGAVPAAGAYRSFVLGTPTHVNRTGFTRYVIRNPADMTSTCPTSFHSEAVFVSANSATNQPFLSVTYTEAPRFSVHIDGVWRSATGVWVNIDGTWRQAVGAWVNIDGTWRRS